MITLLKIMKIIQYYTNLKVLEQGTGIFSQMIDETSDDNLPGLLNGDSTLQNRKSQNSNTMQNYTFKQSFHFLEKLESNLSIEITLEKFNWSWSVVM